MKITISVDIEGLEAEIESVREQQGISYGALGKVAGVTSSSCWQILNGQGKATKLETVWKIAQALDIDLSGQFKVALMEQTPIWKRTEG